MLWNGIEFNQNCASPTRGTSDKTGHRQIVKEEDLDTLLKQFRHPTGEEMKKDEIKGYYEKKVKYNVKTVNDFISKLRKTAICDKLFS